MDVCVKRGAELSTDHHLVLCKLRLASSSRMQRIGPKRHNRIRWEALADEAVRRNFAESVDQRFSRLPPKKTDIEIEWLLFRTVILGAATETCGAKRVGPPIGQKRIVWWNDEVRAVVAEKKAAYKTWIRRQPAETRQKYLQAPDRTKEIVAKAKAASPGELWTSIRVRLFIGQKNNILADHPPPSKGSMSNNLLDQERLWRSATLRKGHP